jgi:hypothetical protein
MLDQLHALVETTGLPSAPRDRVRALVDIAIGALGQSFVEQPRMKRDAVSGQLRASHPLLRLGTGRTSDEIALAEWAEVGLYLEAFARDPRIKDCVVGLKSQFESTLFQLAVAFRLRAAGCGQVVLEPDTARGRAHIAFQHEGVCYVAECYRINKTFFDYFQEAQGGFLDALFDLLPEEKTFSVTVSLGAPPTFDTFRRVLRRIAEMRDELKQRPDVVHLQRRLDRHLVGLEDITDTVPDPDFDMRESGPPLRKRYQDADTCTVLRNVVNRSLIEAVDSSVTSGTRGTRVHIWKHFSEVPTKKPHEILLSRLNTKLKQTKPLKPGVFRLLFADFPFGLFLPMRNPGSLHEVTDRAARHFTDVAGIFVMERSFEAANRFSYRAAFLPVSPQKELLRQLVDRLGTVEGLNFFTPTNPSSG